VDLPDLLPPLDRAHRLDREGQALQVLRDRRDLLWGLADPLGLEFPEDRPDLLVQAVRGDR
jgi:hypothetical protein